MPSPRPPPGQSRRQSPPAVPATRRSARMHRSVVTDRRPPAVWAAAPCSFMCVCVFIFCTIEMVKQENSHMLRVASPPRREVELPPRSIYRCTFVPTKRRKKSDLLRVARPAVELPTRLDIPPMPPPTLLRERLVQQQRLPLGEAPPLPAHPSHAFAVICTFPFGIAPPLEVSDTPRFLCLCLLGEGRRHGRGPGSRRPGPGLLLIATRDNGKYAGRRHIRQLSALSFGRREKSRIHRVKSRMRKTSRPLLFVRIMNG
jgi:hypothetical protein